MPGVIGASIFSPRPARGYRFHSLQVEIIIVPSRPQKAGYQFDENLESGSVRFCCNSNALLPKSAQKLAIESNISRMFDSVIVNARQFTANFGKCGHEAAPK